MVSGRMGGGGADADFGKFFLFDVLVATVVGIVAWIITKDDITSFLISLVIAVILLLVELRFQLTQVNQTVAEGLGFQGETARDPFLKRSVAQLVESYGRVTATDDHYFIERAQERVSQCTTALTRLGEGVTELTSDQTFDAVLQRTREARESIFATALSTVEEFWFSGTGKQYFQENVRAVERGVRITRVYIIENQVGLSELAIKALRAQVDGGIEVRIVHAKDLGPDLLHDMAVFDEEYVAYADIIPGSTVMRGARIYRDPAEIRRALQLQAMILRDSRPYEPGMLDVSTVDSYSTAPSGLGGR